MSLNFHWREITCQQEPLNHSLKFGLNLSSFSRTKSDISLDAVSQESVILRVEQSNDVCNTVPQVRKVLNVFFHGVPLLIQRDKSQFNRFTLVI